MIARQVRWFAILIAMDQRPEPPPWGKLISDALKRSGLSARKAAQRAGMSDGRWRQITSGYQNVSRGVFAPVQGPAETVARMAQVVGATPEQLEGAGRADAAEELRTLLGAREPSHRELIDDLRAKLDELRAVMDRELDSDGRPVRNALIDGLRAEVERSTTNRADR